MQDETASGAGLSHAKLAGVIAGACAAAVLALGNSCHCDISCLVTAENDQSFASQYIRTPSPAAQLCLMMVAILQG